MHAALLVRLDAIFWASLLPVIQTAHPIRNIFRGRMSSHSGCSQIKPSRLYLMFVCTSSLICTYGSLSQVRTVSLRASICDMSAVHEHSNAILRFL